MSEEKTSPVGIAIAAIVVFAVAAFIAINEFGSDNKKANELFSESIIKLSYAKQFQNEEGLASLDSAFSDVEQIITDYKGSDIAVKILAGEPLFDGISLSEFGEYRKAYVSVIEIRRKMPEMREEMEEIMQQAQDIAEGKAPAPACLDEQTRGTLDPITQIWIEDYLNKPAPNIEIYATDNRSYSIEKSRNTRVIVMLMRATSPGCQQSVAILNQIYDQTSRSDLRILAVSQETPASLDAFVKRTGAKFPVGKAATLPSEPYGEVQSFPTFFIINPKGLMEKILIGPQSIEKLKQ